MIDRIHWLGFGSFAVLDVPRIYINPRRIARPPQPADFILVSHADYNVCSPADIEKLRDSRTQIVGNEAAANEIPNSTIIRVWQTIGAGRACIKAVPADDSGVGFVISLNYFDIYYTGSNKSVTDMSRIRADIVMLPIADAGSNDALNAEQAAEVIAQIRPRYTIPFQWNASPNSSSMDLLAFARLVGERSQVVLPHTIKA